MNPGIRVRHGKLCPTRGDGRCTCKPTHRANVWNVIEALRLMLAPDDDADVASSEPLELTFAE